MSWIDLLEELLPDKFRREIQELSDDIACEICNIIAKERGVQDAYSMTPDQIAEQIL